MATQNNDPAREWFALTNGDTYITSNLTGLPGEAYSLSNADAFATPDSAQRQLERYGNLFRGFYVVQVRATVNPVKGYSV